MGGGPGGEGRMNNTEDKPDSPPPEGEGNEEGPRPGKNGKGVPPGEIKNGTEGVDKGKRSQQSFSEMSGESQQGGPPKEGEG